MAIARTKPASSSGTALAAVMAPTSEWPATMSATTSRAESNTRIFGAFTGAPACLITLATAMWLGLPSEVDSEMVSAAGSAASRCTNSAPLVIRESAREMNAIYSV